RRLVGVACHAATTAAPDLATLLAVGAGAAAAAVVAAQLQLRKPLLLTEKEPSLLVVDRVRRRALLLPALLDLTQTPHHLLNAHGVDVKEGFDRNRYL